MMKIGMFTFGGGYAMINLLDNEFVERKKWLGSEEFEALVFDTYNVRADYPFEEDFVTGVFRHENGKWFAIAMEISERKLGKDVNLQTQVVNFKCAPEIIESIAGFEPGIYRAQL